MAHLELVIECRGHARYLQCVCVLHGAIHMHIYTYVWRRTYVWRHTYALD